MLLLTRPPYLRWAAAILVLAAAVAWDLSGRATEPYPVAARPIAQGAAIGPDDVRWVDVPADSLPVPDLAGRRAATDIAPGDPIAASSTTGRPTIPEEWWAVPIELPVGLPEGADVRLLLPSGRAVDGLVAAAAVEDVFAGPTGAVAVPNGDVDEVAAAAAAGLALVVIRP